MKKAVLGILILAILVLMNILLFREHLQDIVPTPIPASFEPVAIGTKVDLSQELLGQPLFFHFTNPACKCSNTQKSAVFELIKKHKEKIQFIVVLETKTEKEATQRKGFLGQNRSSCLV